MPVLENVFRQLPALVPAFISFVWACVVIQMSYCSLPWWVYAGLGGDDEPDAGGQIAPQTTPGGL